MPQRYGKFMSEQKFAALVLAGSRTEGDPVARHAGMVSKAVVPVGGTPMLARVLIAIDGSLSIDRVTVVGLAEAALRDEILFKHIERSGARLEAGGDSPAASVERALTTIDPGKPVLITTADHALLSPRIVDDFLDAADTADTDVVIGLVRYEKVLSVCPGTRRTVTRLRDGAFCGCNLFALRTPRGRRAVDFFTRLEQHRKHPARIARTLGVVTLLRFLFRRLTLAQAMARLSSLTGARVGAVLLPYGEAAIDVDKPDDLIVAEALLQR